MKMGQGDKGEKPEAGKMERGSGRVNGGRSLLAQG